MGELAVSRAPDVLRAPAVQSLHGGFAKVIEGLADEVVDAQRLAVEVRAVAKAWLELLRSTPTNLLGSSVLVLSGPQAAGSGKCAVPSERSEGPR